MNAKNDSITARGRPRAVLLVLGLALLLLLAAGLFLTDILSPVQVVASAEKEEQLEPHAGEWQTWILASGNQLRLSPPPDKATTKDEIDELLALAEQCDAAALTQIACWNSGAPAYRWNEIARAT